MLKGILVMFLLWCQLVTIAIVGISKNPPSHKIFWLIFGVLLPGVGLAFFFALGNRKGI